MRLPSVHAAPLRRPAALLAALAAALTGTAAAVVPASPAQAAERCAVSYRVVELQPASSTAPAQFTGRFTVTNTGTVTLDGMWWVPASWPTGTVINEIRDAWATPYSNYAFTPLPSIAVIQPGQSVAFEVVGRPAAPASERTATPSVLSCQLV